MYLNTPSAYDKAADEGSILHQDSVLTKPADDHQRSMTLNVSSAYDKAADGDGGSLLHQGPVLTKRVNNHVQSIAVVALNEYGTWLNSALNGPVNSSGGRQFCDNPSLAMQSKRKEDEEGSIQKFDEGDACVDEIDDDKVCLCGFETLQSLVMGFCSNAVVRRLGISATCELHFTRLCCVCAPNKG